MDIYLPGIGGRINTGDGRGWRSYNPPGQESLHTDHVHIGLAGDR